MNPSPRNAVDGLVHPPSGDADAPRRHGYDGCFPGSEGISSRTIELKDHGNFFGRVHRFPRLSLLGMEKLARFLFGVGVILIGLEISVLTVIAPWAAPSCSYAARESTTEPICFVAGGLLLVGVGVAATRWSARRSRGDRRCLTSAEQRRHWKTELTLSGVFYLAAVHAGLADTMPKAIVSGVAAAMLSSGMLQLILRRD